MGDKTEISWTDATWNPVRGCSRVSEGCRHCYAEVQAARIVRIGRGIPTAYDGLVRLAQIPPSLVAATAPSEDPGWIRNGDNRAFAFGVEARWTGKVVLDSRKLAEPLSWKKPRRIFVNSMSDLFHESLTNEQIAAVFGVMAACPQHTFQVLTKRARRMREWFTWVDSTGYAPGHALAGALNNVAKLSDTAEREQDQPRWPLPNVWLGVSVENQKAADERIPNLLATPAAVRFLSCDPLLGEVDLNPPLCDDFDRHGSAGYCVADDEATTWCSECDSERSYGHWLHLDGGIDWVIAGCESGPGARPCDVSWLRSLRDQCSEELVPFFLKQARYGCGCPSSHTHTDIEGCEACTCTWSAGDRRVGSVESGITAGPRSKRKPGGIIELPYLDGIQHATFPLGMS